MRAEMGCLPLSVVTTLIQTRFVLILLLLVRLFGVTDPQRTIIPSVPSENMRGKIVAKQF